MVYYVPSQDEIRARAEILRWMMLMEWDMGVIDAILYRDNPTPETVRRLAYQHGPERAYDILVRMLED